MGSINWCILCSALVTLSHQTIDYRLPKDSIPGHYKLKIEPHIIPGNFTFNGEVEISLTVLQPTDNITLHCVDLNIDQESTTLIYKSAFLRPERHIFQQISQLLILQFRDVLQRGNYTLLLKYSANLDKENEGFFLTSYFNHNNEFQSLVATVFEPTFARGAFPCWDEPAFKATFDIWIKHVPKYTALSNMPVERVVNDTKTEGKIWTVFQTTPPISTYLVAFAVSEFEHVTNSQGNVSIWTRKNALNSVEIGLKCALKAIPILEKYTGIPYVLPKLDVIVIPGYSFGAMENWGLIVFGEVDMLRNSNSSLTDKRRTAQIIVHELSHQWFGNLVSPEWWSDLWIAEGIPTYLEYFLSAKVLKEPKIKDLFVVENNYEELSVDIGSMKNPLVSVKDDPESLDLHSRKLHRKAAAVIYMMSGLMSEHYFQLALRKLLNTYRFKTINTNMFFTSMQEVIDKEKLPQTNFDLMTVMNFYLQQTGYLVINVTRDCATGQIRLTQSCAFCKSNQTQKFWVPINFATGTYPFFSSTFVQYWLSPFEDQLIINGVDPNDLVIFNIKSTGFYRLIYDEENWRRIINYLNSKQYSKIHAINRAALLEDALWATKHHDLNINLLKNLTSYLLHEREYVPWVSGLKVLKFLQLSCDSSMSMRAFLYQFAYDVYKRLRTEVETDLHGNLLVRCKLQRIVEWIETKFNVTDLKRFKNTYQNITTFL